MSICKTCKYFSWDFVDEDDVIHCPECTKPWSPTSFAEDCRLEGLETTIRKTDMEFSLYMEFSSFTENYKDCTSCDFYEKYDDSER